MYEFACIHTHVKALQDVAYDLSKLLTNTSNVLGPAGNRQFHHNYMHIHMCYRCGLHF